MPPAPIAFKQIRSTDPEFEECFDIRLRVFVEEQNVPLDQERDADDAAAVHFLGLRNDVAIATARVVFKDDGTTAKIGRVAVLQSARGTGAGAALMRHIEASLGARRFLLDAQSYACGFYQRLGYAAEGEEFIEAGIPHVHMRKDR